MENESAAVAVNGSDENVKIAIFARSGNTPLGDFCGIEEGRERKSKPPGLQRSLDRNDTRLNQAKI
jgi:hypothetical protein